MKILQYNILNGCQNDPERYRKLLAWLKTQKCDVVGLNELNGWHEEPGLQTCAQICGFSYAELFVTKESRHLVGLLSRYPIELLEDREAGFHHGLLHVSTAGIHFLVTHLTPTRADKRLAETAILASIVATVKAPLAIMGDLNTLSPLDRQFHEAEGLRQVLQRDEGLAHKFLNEKGQIDYRPMQQLLDAGLTDGRIETGHDYTVPTELNADPMHATRMRLDYILGNDAFQACTGPVKALRTAETDELSDHYPVACSYCT